MEFNEFLRQIASIMGRENWADFSLTEAGELRDLFDELLPADLDTRDLEVELEEARQEGYDEGYSDGYTDAKDEFQVGLDSEDDE